MKTKSILCAIILSILIGTSAFADNFEMKEEAYIPDIPFNTAEIFNAYMASDTNNALLQIEEEAYIDDIPFNTHTIAAQQCCEKAMNKNFEMEEEAYINDIPFDTKTIAWQVLSHANQMNSKTTFKYFISSAK
jgi:hypothetical protein